MKVGDRVEIVDTDFCSCELANGKTGTIVYDYGVRFGVHCLGIEVDSGYEPAAWDDSDPSPKSWAFYKEQIKVIK